MPGAAARLDVVSGVFPHGPRQERPYGNRVAEGLAGVGPSRLRGGLIGGCRDGDGSRYVVVARYRDHTEVAELRRNGCRDASNGTFTARYGATRVTPLLDGAFAG
ncbi:MAG TPA: hypothetical protein VGX28_11695 [Frankiaceae bacterium]|nr:hypothetical protein [Frankiaceae bacterium]